MAKAFRNISPGSPYATTSLGAVGGARGTAAGALKVLVEFVTQYDQQGIEKLKVDLANFHADQVSAEQTLATAERDRLTLQDKFKRGQDIIREQLKNTDETLRKNFKAAIADIGVYDSELDKIAQKAKAGPLSAADKSTRGKLIAEQTKLIKAQAQALNIDEEALRVASKILQTKRQLAAIDARIAGANARIEASLENQAIVQQEITILERVRSQFLPKLGALALGAVGGIFGGALFGVGFEAAQGLIDNISNSLRDIVDPAYRAREALKDVGDAVNKIADQEKLGRLRAAESVIKNLGLLGSNQLTPGINNPITAARLAEAAALKDINDNLETFIQYAKVARDIDLLRAETITKVTDGILAQSNEYKELNDLLLTNVGKRVGGSIFDVLIDGFGNLIDPKTPVDIDAVSRRIAELRAEAAALAKTLLGVDTSTEKAVTGLQELNNLKLEGLRREIAFIAGYLEESIRNSADRAIAAIQGRLDASITQIDTVVDKRITARRARLDRDIAEQQQLLDSLKLTPSNKTESLRSQLDALDDAGPSRRTRELAAAIEALNKAEERRAYLNSLNENREERRLILLERYLSRRKREIDYTKYSGEARILAIDAEISRLQKANEAQQKKNELLERQYRLSQDIRRSEGETIQDFLKRRSFEYRQALIEGQSSAFDSRIARLQDVKTQTEFRIRLQKNAAERLDLIRQHDLEQHQEALQRALEASQNADQAALNSRKEALQKQLDASEQADRDEYEASKKAIQDRIEQLNTEADEDIEIIRKAGEDRKKTLKKQAEEEIKERERIRDSELDKLKRSIERSNALVDQGHNEEMRLAIRAAKNLEDLNLVSGAVAGSSFSYALLKSQIEALNLPAYISASILASADSLRAQYLAQFQTILLQNNRVNRPIPGMASGGVFPITNSMNFGDRLRAGEQGTELGVILSHRVTKALRDSRSGFMMGDINITTSQDPYRAQYELRQTIREVVREELH